MYPDTRLNPCDGGILYGRIYSQAGAPRNLFLQMMKNTFLEFITDSNYKEIVEVLCRMRAREADRRGETDKMKRLSSEYGKKTKTKKKKRGLPLIYQLMPPRRQWIELNYEERTREVDAGKRQRLTTFDYNKKALGETIRRDRKKRPSNAYLARLDAFIAEFIEWVQSDGFAITQVSVVPIPKKYEKDGHVECRPVTMFTDLKEAVLLVLINKFLTRQFDGWFYNESLAFRAKRLYHGEMKPTTHHDAIERIAEYRQRFADRELFVAECDMKKFYDTVSHREVRKAFNALFGKLQRKNGCRYDLEKKLVGAFLQCYTFPKNVLQLNNQRAYWIEKKIKGGYFKWVKKELVAEGLYKERSIRSARVGVPQGGALSGLIANAVLDAVDKRVERMLTDEDLYLRYCDDMILLSTDRDRCERIFEVYQQTLKELRLVPHPPSTDVFNRRKFWVDKTKKPYLWALGRADAPEWIGFVGYEIKRDGCIRIRKKSLNNEIKKQRKYAVDLFEKLKGLKRVSDDSINASITNHLINMSVGRVTLWNADYIAHELCWMNGFRGLNDNPYARRQVKRLDRCRNNTIQIATKKFEAQKLDETHREEYKSGTKKKDERLTGAVRFYGKPYSYYYHYKRVTKK